MGCIYSKCIVRDNCVCFVTQIAVVIFTPSPSGTRAVKNNWISEGPVKFNRGSSRYMGVYDGDSRTVYIRTYTRVCDVIFRMSASRVANCSRSLSALCVCVTNTEMKKQKNICEFGEERIRIKKKKKKNPRVLGRHLPRK